VARVLNEALAGLLGSGGGDVVDFGAMRRGGA
jgi:hypothetical protein